MFNLIRGEFYKLRKGRNLWVCLIASVIFILFLYVTMSLADHLQASENAKTNIGVEVIEGDSGIWNQIGIIDMTQQALGGIGGIITAVFACIFVIGEFNNGSIKNIVGKGYSRWKIFAAKYITTVVTAAFLLFFMTIVSLVVGMIVAGTENIDKSFLFDLSVYAGLEIILGASLTGIMVVISEYTRNLGIGITISLGVIMFSSFLFSFFDLLCHSLNVKPSNYWLMDLITDCPVTGVDSGFAIRAVVMSFVWIALSMILGIMHFQKADIK